MEEGDAHFDGGASSCWSCDAPLNQGQVIGVCTAASAAQGGECFPLKRWCPDCLEGPFTSRPEADEEEEPEQSDAEWTAGLEWYKCRCDGELAKIDWDTLEEGEAIFCALCDCDVGDQAVYGCLNDCQGPVCEQCATDPDRFRVFVHCEPNGDSFVTMCRGVTFDCSECGAHEDAGDPAFSCNGCGRENLCLACLDGEPESGSGDDGDDYDDGDVIERHGDAAADAPDGGDDAAGGGGGGKRDKKEKKRKNFDEKEDKQQFNSHNSHKHQQQQPQQQQSTTINDSDLPVHNTRNKMMKFVKHIIILQYTTDTWYNSLYNTVCYDT